MHSPRGIAEWMVVQLGELYYLYPEHLVYEIEAEFGEAFVYFNERGNLAIDRAVLKEFRALTEETVVWDLGEKAWRFREEWDPPGKRTST